MKRQHLVVAGLAALLAGGVILLFVLLGGGDDELPALRVERVGRGERLAAGGEQHDPGDLEPLGVEPDGGRRARQSVLLPDLAAL